jgi:hypothetical protein
MGYGFYNTQEDVDRLIEAVEMIPKEEYKGEHRLDARLCRCLPENSEFDYQD